MSRFVLIVDLVISPEGIDTFLEAVAVQAAKSVSDEPQCYRFDVVRDAENPNKVTHYEIFEDEAAFQAHTTMPHTAAFSQIVQPLILEQSVRHGRLLLSESD